MSKAKGDTSQYRHQHKYSTAQKEDGFIRVSVWVPLKNRAELLQAAKEYRDKVTT